MRIVRKILTRLIGDKRAVAMTEFALATPFVLMVGLYGIETANMALVHMRVSQAAMQIADNGSRIGDTATLQNRKIYESDINDLLYGAHLHSGESLDLFEHGRVIVSSLHSKTDKPKEQFISWQRCIGKKSWASSYGDEGDGVSTKMHGMGPGKEQVSAPKDGALIFVELAYEYQPLFTDAFMDSKTMQVYSAFIVRDDRDLSQIYQRDPGDPDYVADCSSNNGVASVSS